MNSSERHLVLAAKAPSRGSPRNTGNGARLLWSFLFWLSSACLLPSHASAAELDCLVKPEMYVEVSSSVVSVLEEILVETGDVVRKGQPLAKLEASVEKARVKMAQLQVDHVSDIENRKVQLQYKKLNHERMQALRLKKSVPQFEADKARTEYALAELELAKARETYGPDHPEIVRLERMVDSLIAKIQDSQESEDALIKPDNPAYIQLQAQKDSLEGEKRTLREQRVKLREQLQHLEDRALRAPGVAFLQPCGTTGANGRFSLRGMPEQGRFIAAARRAFERCLCLVRSLRRDQDLAQADQCREHLRVRVAVGFGCVLLTGLARAYVPQAFRFAINALPGEAPDLELATWWVVAAVLLTALRGGFQYLMRRNLVGASRELERRLRDRGTDSEPVIERRLQDAVSDMSHWDEFDYVVINDELNEAVVQLQSVLDGESLAAATTNDALRAAVAGIVG